MIFHQNKLLASISIALLTLTGAVAPALARPLNQANESQLLSQVNQPEREGVPSANVETVSGRIVSINGDQVEVRLSNNETRTYTISQETQQRYNLAADSDVTLTVTRGTNTVVAVNPINRSIDPSTTVGATQESSTTGTTSTTGAVSATGTTSTTGTTGSTSQSTTVIRRQTTVTQQTTPAQPAPRPATRPAPAPAPVRALW